MKLGQSGLCSAPMLKSLFSPDSPDMTFRFVGPSETPAGSGQFSCRRRLNSVLSLDGPVAPSLTQTLLIQTTFKLSLPHFKIQGNILEFPKIPDKKIQLHVNIHTVYLKCCRSNPGFISFSPESGFCMWSWILKRSLGMKIMFYLSYFMSDEAQCVEYI